MHIIETLDVGGAECVVADFANHMKGDVFLSICCLKHSGKVAERIDSSIEIVSMGKEEGNDPLLPFRLAKLLKKKHIDVVHTHNWGVFLEGVIAACIARIPVTIHMAHGSLLTYEPTFLGWIKKTFRRKAEFFMSLFCDQVISVSSDLKELISREIGIPKNKIIVMKNGISTHHLMKSSRSKLEKYGISPEDYVVVFVGRLVKVKNVPLLLQSIQRFYPRYSHVKLIIIGDGPERRRIEALIHQLGLSSQVLMLGFRNDIAEILSGCDLFVLPSFSEGISISLLEGMGQRLPVIATRVGGNVEVVENHKTGILVESDNVDEMYKALKWFVEHPALGKQYGEDGFNKVCAEYNLEKNILMIRGLYQKYLVRKKGVVH